MAKATLEIVEVLRKTAEKIENSAHYQWGHMGNCNCGFLAQEITHLNREQIHKTAMQGNGDWTEQLNDYCPTSGLNMDALISAIVNFGFDTDDLKHLERLSDPVVLRSFPLSERNLSHNIKAHVVLYMRRWAALVENSILSTIDISAISDQTVMHTNSNL
jgi:hypothetical protein